MNYFKPLIYKWTIPQFLLLIELAVVVSSVVSKKFYLQHIAAILLSTLIGICCCFAKDFITTIEENINPDALLTFIYPVLIIKLIYATDPYMLIKSMWQIFFISTIGFWVLTVLIGLVSDFMIEQSVLRFEECMVLGVLYQLGDFPDVKKKVEGVKNLEMLINLDCFISLFYTDTSLAIMHGIELGCINRYYHVVFVVLRYALLSTVVGVVLGFLFASLLRCCYSDQLNAVVVIIISSYMGYILAVYFLHCSGIVTSGWIVFMISQERSGLSPQVDTAVKSVINECSFIAHRVVTVAIVIINSVYYAYSFDGIEIILGLFGFFIQISFRSIVFIILSRFLSCSRYGFNFTSLIIFLWRPHKGPIVMLYCYKLYRNGLLFHMDIFFYIYIYQLLQFTLNRFLQNATLEKFDLGRFVLIHQNNVSNAIKMVQIKRDNVLSIMKINRFFSGANWTMINKVTELANPYENEDDNLFDNVHSRSTRMTTCPKCFQKLEVQPTKGEIIEMSRAARTRILKAKRMSFIHHYEKGYLNRNQVNDLLFAVDQALDSEELFLNFSNFLKDKQEPPLFRHLRVFVRNYQVVPATYVQPTQPFKKMCYWLMNGLVFEIVRFCITLALAGVKLAEIREGKITEAYIIAEVVLFIISWVIFFIAVAACSATSFRHGFETYFRISWNGMTFISLIINVVDIYIFMLRFAYGETKVIVVLKILACLRVLRIFKYIAMCYPKIFAAYSLKLDKHALNSYIVAKAILSTYDEVMHDLKNLTNDRSITDALKTRLTIDRNDLMEMISVLMKNRPWLASTVQSTQSTRCILKAMKYCVHDLKFSGMIDSIELHKLVIALDEKFKQLQTYVRIETVTPSLIFKEINWIHDDDDVYEYLFAHANNKIWHTGEVVRQVGEVYDDILIVVEGMFKAYYQPMGRYLRRLDELGQLPVKEVITTTNFAEDQVDFIMVGGFIGELAIMTSRECSSTVICNIPARALVLSKNVMEEAMLLNPNPIYGLWSRIWKNIAFNLIERLLLETTFYEQAKTDLTIYLLENAFVPNLKNFKTLILCEYVMDVILIDGMLLDDTTKEVYKGPCYMPRFVQKYGFMMEEVILCIIPLKNTDPIDVMFRLEKESELIDNIDVSAMIANYLITSRKSKAVYKTKKRRNTTFAFPGDLQTKESDESPKMCRCKRNKEQKEDTD